MRLAIQLLDFISVNSFTNLNSVDIVKGETKDIYFQLMNHSTGLRYVPTAPTTVAVSIPRQTQITGDINNNRQYNDYSINKYATQASPSDGSIWKISLTSSDTTNMISAAMKVTVTEGVGVQIAILDQAVQMQGA